MSEKPVADVKLWKLFLAGFLCPLGIFLAGVETMMCLLNCEHYSMFTGELWKPIKSGAVKGE